MTRRQFITSLLLAGLPSAAIAAAVGDTLPHVSPPRNRQPDTRRIKKSGKVIILGAGLAGLTSAHELIKRGYECHILEAQTRAGGRCITIRQGDSFVEDAEHIHLSHFDDDQYFNPGPARIPSQHITLDYCRRFHVPIELFPNRNLSTYLHTDNGTTLSGRSIRFREVLTDLQGYVFELLAKALGSGALDAEIGHQERVHLLEFLKVNGDLAGPGSHLHYAGSNRRGYTTEPGAGPTPGSIAHRHLRADLLHSGLGNKFQHLDAYDQQMNMFQIVGGTGKLADAMAQKLPIDIYHGCRVKEIRNTSKGVSIVYQPGTGDHKVEITADYCICTIPLPVLRTLQTDFSPRLRRAVDAVSYESAVKVGLQMSRRFWEEDERIFAGITMTDLPITQIWYPASGFLGKKGMLVGCYNFGKDAESFGRMSSQSRIDAALKQGGQIHRGYRKHFDNGFSIAWQNVGWTGGAYALFDDHTRAEHYPALIEPDGRVYLAGEHTTYLNGWMAGAIESGLRAVDMIHARHQTTDRRT